MALCLCFAAVTSFSAAVWSSDVAFDGTPTSDTVVLKPTDNIGYSTALARGTDVYNIYVKAVLNGSTVDYIVDKEDWSGLPDADKEGTAKWNYDKPFIQKYTNYTIKEEIGTDREDYEASRTVYILPEPAILIFLGLLGAFFLRRRTKVLLTVLAAIALCSFSANATTSVSSVNCLQLFPIHREVIINYTITTDYEGDLDINFYGSTDQGATTFNLADKGTLTKDGSSGKITTGSGTYKTIWTPDSTLNNVTGTIRVGVEVTEYVPPKTFMIIDVSGGYQAQSYPVSYTDEEPSGGWNINEYKTTKIVLKYCPPGSFTMGSPGDELGRQSDETQRNITLTKGFYVGIFEVTDQQYGEIYNGSWNITYPTIPIKDVSYATIRGSSWPSSTTPGANSFMDKLNSRTGLSFDLPTEAQWEYACRGETTKATNRDENLSRTGECDEMDRVANYYANTGIDAVGSKMPSFSGTYDMHGNAGELCLDWYGSYDTDDLIDPTGPDTGSYRVVRGGNCDNDARECRSASRSNTNSAFSFYTGFRLFMVVD